ncbi:hypothetical protein BW723_17120 [Polaribacter reichenbachii]|uniref:Uncharacterized protein n=1 Tax=Polaribacter reichenbachii TaxID=996801 RepID=A0A1B8U445_9FLAO|nr:hypothetical protein [Polaribacter reichenbachii]APZ47910.1 hypothetical protein BW723_17120 [Polaribacter reichenbachii]AUC18542.1 hypothetical protein BTO17_07515 [Polaribacter reichenbachii]OBY66612.1 hypothetical protein LPB301_06340 [Polaribacter reichenbachii]
MKKFFKIIATILLLIIGFCVVYYFINNEDLPQGKKGKEADALAIKMYNAINHEAFENTEILKWSFRNEHFYTWHKQQNIVHISWAENKVTLNTKQPEKSVVYVDGKISENKKLIKQAQGYFNNDSFWLIAPYKIFDAGTERSIIKHEGKNALMVTYTSGGSTPGDSYLWILDENYYPTSFKMWTSVIPIGGVSGSWSNWKKTEAGIKLPTKHTLSLFGLEIDMGNVNAYNEKANELADKILKALKHEAYKETKFIEWSFAGKRSFNWDKKNHIVDVSWDDFKVNLYPEDLEKSIVFFEGVKQEDTDEKIVKRAWDIFNNDSFWLVAPHKLYDDGVIRTIENIENETALRITYTSGGTTPGDAYVWILDENYVPKSYKMYLKNRGKQGTLVTWDDWVTTESGTLLPTNHTFLNGRRLSMGEVKAYN